MRIDSINYYNTYNTPYYNPSFEAIKIRQINPAYSGMQSRLERELEAFAQKGNNVDLLGEGVSSAVYSFKKLHDFVFKKSHLKKENFDTEINNLRTLPEKIKNVQRFVAQAFDDETGLFYLISTKMNGKEASFDKNPWTRKHLKSLFATMFEMDKNGIYHGDLHCGNILLDKTGKAGFIDFQWTQKILKKRFFENNQSSLMPPFILNENSQMFEMASIPYYIKFMDNPKDGKAFLRMYLSEKALYHEKRSDYLRSLIKEWPYDYEQEIILKGINYEDAQSILFRHPDDDVMRIETKKIQFLSSFRDSFGKTDPSNKNRDFITAASSQLVTLSAIQELRHEIALQKANKLTSNIKSTYLDLTEEYAKYWYDNVRSWINGIFEGSLKTAEETQYIPIKSANRKFESVTNLFDFVDDGYKSSYTNDFAVSKLANNQRNTKDTEHSLKRIRELNNSLPFDPRTFRLVNEIQEINKKLRHALKNDWGLDLINLSIMNIVKNRELKSLIVQNTNIHARAKNDMITELHKSKLIYRQIAEDNFKYILNIINSDTPESMRLSGYKGMYNFE